MISNADFLHCRHFPQCKGCSLLNQSFQQQFATKLESLKQKLQPIFEVLDIQPTFPSTYGTRERLDFTVLNGRIGLFAENKELIDIDLCPQMTGALNQALKYFRDLKLPLQKASIRLRVGPFSKPGLWIDAGNLEIKSLLEESSFLDRASEVFWIEIGQKGKSAQKINGLWKLVDPVFQEWSSTFAQGIEYPLLSTVSSFTQPGRLSNKALCQQLEAFIQTHGLQGSWTEIGAGIGNFSILLSRLFPNQAIEAIENNPLAVKSIRLNKEKHGGSNLTINDADFQRGNVELKLHPNVFVNPPRSGLQRTAGLLNSESSVKTIIYLSCFPESFVEDVQKMPNIHVEQIAAIDQFSGSEHLEVMAILRRK